MPNRKLTIFLLQESIKTPSQALRSAMEVLPVDATLGPTAGLVVKIMPEPREPTWKDFVGQYTEKPLQFIPTQSSSAVLFVQASGRLFALTFGYGRSLLEPDAVEPMFGLKVVVNRVDPDKLRSLDVKTFQATTFQVRQQAAGVTPLDTFGLNVRRDILNAVAGKPTGDELGTSLAGRDSLTTSIDLKKGDLILLCERCLAAFSDDKYKDRFGWIDTLRPVRDSKLTESLDTAVANALKSGQINGIDLVMPDILDPERITGFKYVGLDERHELHTDLDIEDFLDMIEDKSLITSTWLKKKSVRYYAEDDSSAINEWSVYKCLAAQLALPGNSKQFVLSTSQWFEVEPSYVKQIDDAVSDRSFIPFPDIYFPECCDASMAEEDYNAFTSDYLQAHCQDRQLVYLGGHRDKIEPCDILTIDGKLIHVKRKTRSSSLSHLFAQARVSADLLRREKSFNEKWVKQLKAAKAASFAKSLKWPCKPENHDVILAVLAGNPEELPEKLPFFARMELVTLAQGLNDAGFRCCFTGLYEEVATKKKGPKASKASSKAP